MGWLREVEEGGVIHHEFVLDRDGRPVPGSLWNSESSQPGCPLICLGHGASGDCYQAPDIQCPLLYLLQLEDELVTRAEGLRMFDAIGSMNKRLHANPGLHDEVPTEELLFSKSFLIEQLGYTSPARAMMWSKRD